MRWKLFGIVLLVVSFLGLGLYLNEAYSQEPAVATGIQTQPTPGAGQPPRSDPNPFGESVIIGYNNGVTPTPGKPLDVEIQKLVAELKRKPDTAKEAKLKELVEKSFEELHDGQLREAEALAARLAKLQEKLKVRQSKKGEIVTRRIKQLLGEPDDLDWEAPAPMNGRRSGGFGAGQGMPSTGFPVPAGFGAFGGGPVMPGPGATMPAPSVLGSVPGGPRPGTIEGGGGITDRTGTSRAGEITRTKEMILPATGFTPEPIANPLAPKGKAPLTENDINLLKLKHIKVDELIKTLDKLSIGAKDGSRLFGELRSNTLQVQCDEATLVLIKSIIQKIDRPTEKKSASGQ